MITKNFKSVRMLIHKVAKQRMNDTGVDVEPYNFGYISSEKDTDNEDSDNTDLKNNSDTDQNEK